MRIDRSAWRRLAAVLAVVSLGALVGCAAPEAEPSEREGASSAEESALTQTCTVRWSELNLRSGPSLSSSVIMKLHYGDRAVVEYIRSGWARLVPNEGGGEEWVYADGLSCPGGSSTRPRSGSTIAKASCFYGVNAATANASFTKRAGEESTVSGTWILFDGAGNRLKEGPCVTRNAGTTEIQGTLSCNAHYDPADFRGAIQFVFRGDNVYTLESESPCR